MEMDRLQVSGILAAALILGLLVGAGLPTIGESQQKDSVETVNPKQVSFSGSESDRTYWVLPGKREIDEHVFGTPQDPKGTNHHTGLPLDKRATNENGTAYTTTKMATPFSDKVEEIEASYSYTAVDRTKRDRKDSSDEISNAEWSFESPGGNTTYTVTVKKKIPVGPAHPFRGGVMVDSYMHGTTGVGTMMQPNQYAYAAFWGVAELEVNDEQVSGNRLIHVMTTERVRTREGELLTNGELPHEGVQTHLIMPPKVVTESGPEKKPVQSGFTLPNGKEQPFIHLVSYDSEMDGMMEIS